MARITVPVCEGRWDIYIYIYRYYNNGLKYVESLKTFSLSYRNNNYLFILLYFFHLWKKSPAIPLNRLWFIKSEVNDSDRQTDRQTDSWTLQYSPRLI